MASRALKTRFSSADSNWAGSMFVYQSPAAAWISTLTISPLTRRVSSVISATNRLTNTRSARSVWRREKDSS